ncbi:MAG: hypothetical protein ABRQ39_28500, partial [Candidatus Eremiobacterota bacterium]
DIYFLKKWISLIDIMQKLCLRHIFSSLYNIFFANRTGRCIYNIQAFPFLLLILIYSSITTYFPITLLNYYAFA